MNIRKDKASAAGASAPASGLLTRLAVELVIGLTFAGLLVIVAWASSNAIRFVYGGY
jgi:hypothetical protein